MGGDGLFLDVFKLDVGSLNKPGKHLELRQVIIDWGVSNGYVDIKPLWRAYFYDGEVEDWRYFTCETEEKARHEIGGNEDEVCPYGKNKIEKVDSIVGTDNLRVRLGVRSLFSMDCFEFLAMVWAEDTQPAIDGIWWAETYDPINLSAPRGGIFPSRLDQ